MEVSSDAKLSPEAKFLCFLFILGTGIGNLFLSSWFMTLVWAWYFEHSYGFHLPLKDAIGLCFFAAFLRASPKLGKPPAWHDIIGAHLGLTVSLCLGLGVAWLVRP